MQEISSVWTQRSAAFDEISWPAARSLVLLLLTVICYLLFSQCSLRDLLCSNFVFWDLVVPKCRLRDLQLSVFWDLLSTQKQQKTRSQISWNPLPRSQISSFHLLFSPQLWTGPHSVHPRLTRDFFFFFFPCGFFFYEYEMMTVIWIRVHFSLFDDFLMKEDIAGRSDDFWRRTFW